MFMNIYFIYTCLYEKCLNPWLSYVTKIKFKGKSTKVLYACMVHGKGLGFFIEGREE